MTTTPEGLPAWLHEGAEVAQLRYGFGPATVRTATVERFTKTQVILDNGDRISTRNVTPRDDRIIPAGHSMWILVSRDSDEYRDVVEQSRIRDLDVTARDAVVAWERSPSDETARAAITALEATLTTTETPS